MTLHPETGFVLHPRLAEDCLVIGDLPLSRLLLMNDATYPWLILVPRRPEVREIYELGEPDQQQLLRESSLVAATLNRLFDADKINLAALGNMVPQLHMHHVARFRNDPAWPGPIWGHAPAVPYPEAECKARISLLKTELADWLA